jgi:hypothetical protein
MPITALALNITWESMYAVHDLMTSVSIQPFVNLIWALADLGIVYTFFKFGRSELPHFVTRSMFAAWAALIFAACLVAQWLFSPAARIRVGLSLSGLDRDRRSAFAAKRKPAQPDQSDVDRVYESDER